MSFKTALKLGIIRLNRRSQIGLPHAQQAKREFDYAKNKLVHQGSVKALWAEMSKVGTKQPMNIKGQWSNDDALL